MLPKKYLSKKHTGLRISANGVLSRCANKRGALNRSDKFLLSEMNKHLHEFANEFYSGNLKIVDEFLQLYCLDKNRLLIQVKEALIKE